jgi:hypothetical protein
MPRLGLTCSGSNMRAAHIAVGLARCKLPEELDDMVEAVLGLDNRPARGRISVRAHRQLMCVGTLTAQMRRSSSLHCITNFPAGTEQGECVAVIGGGERPGLRAGRSKLRVERTSGARRPRFRPLESFRRRPRPRGNVVRAGV